MKCAKALQTAEEALHQAGFQVSRRCTTRANCFDFAARNEEHLIFVKAFHDIRNISQIASAAIKAVTRCFSCVPIFISDMNDEEALKDDTVYLRYGVHVVTSKTFEDVALRDALPLVEAAPGGYFVRVDGGKIKERRHELGLSIGKLASMVGVSRRTLYGYERCMARASVSAAYQLGKILGVPIAKTIDIFEAPSGISEHYESFSDNCERAANSLLKIILTKLTQFDLKVSPMNGAPFDFAANCPQAGFKIIGGVFEKNERLAKERAEEIVSLSRIIEAKPLLLGEEKIAASEDIAFINCSELARIRDKQELAALL